MDPPPQPLFKLVGALMLQSLGVEMSIHFFIFTKSMPMEPKITDFPRAGGLLSGSLVCIHYLIKKKTEKEAFTGIE